MFDDILAENWVGGMKIYNRLHPIILGFRVAESQLQGHLLIPNVQKEVELEQICLKQKALCFQVNMQSEKWLFSGSLEKESISGNIINEGLYGSFWLSPFYNMTREQLSQCVGSYLTTEGHIVNCTWNKNSLKCLDYRSGRYAIAFPISETEFVERWPLSDGIGFDEKRQILFSQNGHEVTGLFWDQGNSICVQGQKTVMFTKEKVSFNNGAIRLSGTLTLPNKNEPSPAIIMVHRSGVQRNYDFWPYSTFYAEHGIAVLTYDKRGEGQSGGDWRQSTFYDLAEDVLAGIEFLKMRQDIDSNRIGLWGYGQGGYTVPVVAASSKDVAFVIGQSIFALSPGQQLISSLFQRLYTTGYSVSEIEDALAYERLLIKVVREDHDWDALEQVFLQAREKSWFSYVSKMPFKYDPRWKWFRLNMDFDPIPMWEKVSCPILALFGERDRESPPEFHSEMLKKAWVNGGNLDWQVHTFPNANYHLKYIDNDTGVQGVSNKYVPEHFDIQIEWLLNRCYPGGVSKDEIHMD